MLEHIAWSLLYFVNLPHFHVNAGATNKPQELDDAVLRRLVGIYYLKNLNCECWQIVHLGCNFYGSRQKLWHLYKYTHLIHYTVFYEFVSFFPITAINASPDSTGYVPNCMQFLSNVLLVISASLTISGTS